MRRFAGEPIRRVLDCRRFRSWTRRGGDRRLRPGARRPCTAAAARRGARSAIVIEHTETLAADGSWFANIVGINKEQTDVFIAAGGDDEWEPEFTFHGFRYARVSGCRRPLAPTTSSRSCSRATSSRPARSGIRPPPEPPAPERRVEPARQLPLDPDRLPAARARRMDRRHPGLRGRREQQRAGRAVPLALARQSARRPAARWAHPDLLAALAVRRRSRRDRPGHRVDRRGRGLERRDRHRAVDALRAHRRPPRARGELRRDAALDRVSAGDGGAELPPALAEIDLRTSAGARRHCSTTPACTSATG